MPKSTRLWKLLKIAEFRTPTPQDVRKKSSKILKLPPVRNCFILAMTNKLVVIINSLKVPKIKKILLCEMKFLVPNYSCLQNPWLWGLPPPDPCSLCPLSSTVFVEPPTKQNSWVRNWHTVQLMLCYTIICLPTTHTNLLMCVSPCWLLKNFNAICSNSFFHCFHAFPLL